MFDEHTRTLESEVTSLLTQSGWVGRRFGQAADDRGHYVAKFGTIEGTFIGVYHDSKRDGAIARFPISWSASKIASAILAQTQQSLVAGPLSAAFSMNGKTYETDEETLRVLQSIIPPAKAEDDFSAVAAVMELGLKTGRIVEKTGKPPKEPRPRREQRSSASFGM